MTLHPITRSTTGFTLIELLVALAILSILSFMSYQGITGLLAAEKRLAGGTKRIQMIDRFFAELERDIFLAAPRPVRLSSTEKEAALLGAVAEGQGNYRINLSRFAPAPDMLPQRISYIFSPPTIGIYATSTMDFPNAAIEKPIPVLDGLQSASVRFMDNDGRWLPSWPPAGRSEAMPRGVELTLVLDDLGTFSRLFARP
jgi:general secretion pathway protein J